MLQFFQALIQVFGNFVSYLFTSQSLSTYFILGIYLFSVLFFVFLRR